MKNTTKRLFTVLLSLVMLMTMAVPALAADTPEIIAQGKAGDKITWTLNSDGLLLLEGEGEMYSYDEYASSPWYDYHESVISAVIGDGITSIGGLMFEDCINMKSVSIPDSVKTIKEAAFGWCYGLGRVIIPSSVTTVENYAFLYCDSTVIVFEGSAPAFGKYAMETVSFAVYPADKKGWTEELFSSLSGETQWFTSGSDETVIAGGEYGDEITWTLTLGGLLTISGKGDMFNKYGDSEEYIPAWRKYASMVETAVIDDGILSLGAFAFYDCVNMKSVSIPDSVTYIGVYSFGWCESLETVTISKYVEFISSLAFLGCQNLSAIRVDSDNPYYSSDEYGVLFDDRGSVLMKAPEKLAGNYTVPDGTLEINEYAFDNCYDLTGVTLPEGLEYIEYCAFNNCENLKTVTFLGNAPYIASDAFMYVSANVYFPEDDPTWTEDMFQSYGGVLTWPAYSDEPVGIAHRAEFTLDEDLSGEPGEIIDVNVYISENEGIAAGLVTLYGSWFTVLDIKPGDWTEGGQYTANLDSGELVWYDSVEHSDEGVFAVYTIQLSEDVEVGDYYYIGLFTEDLTGVKTDENGKEVVVGYYYGKYARYQDFYTYIHVTGNPISRVIGDFNNDWDISNVDIVILARWLVNLVEPDSDYDKMVLRNGDFNFDGEINNADLVTMARYRVGLYD